MNNFVTKDSKRNKTKLSFAIPCHRIGITFLYFLQYPMSLKKYMQTLGIVQRQINVILCFHGNNWFRHSFMFFLNIRCRMNSNYLSGPLTYSSPRYFKVTQESVNDDLLTSSFKIKRESTWMSGYFIGTLPNFVPNAILVQEESLSFVQKKKTYTQMHKLFSTFCI